MVDMTDNNENKKDFITNILMDYEGNYYYVVYADGHIEKNAFDVESYNEVLLQMEREYYNYKESYGKKLSNQRLKESIKMILTDLITGLGLFLTLNLETEEMLKVVCLFIVGLIGIMIHQQFNAKIYELDVEIDDLYIMSELVKRKEEFAIDVTDPETGETKKWYAINLSNIYTIASPKTLDSYTKEENKLKRVPSFLKKKREIQDAR